MNPILTDFHQAHQFIYPFLRKKWGVQQVALLKRTLLETMRTSDDESAFAELVADMKSAVTAVQELHMRNLG